MSFAEWNQLSHDSPESAAREFHRRLQALSSDQQKAVISWVPSVKDLTASFRRGNSSGGGLAGIPYLLKDVIPVRGVTLHAGSSFLQEVRHPPEADGHLVKSLENAGAVLAGTTNLNEFACGLTGENPHFGDVVHPRHPERMSGGSSSGSAAAVASGLVPLAIGTDTGGSIRVPSAFCGIYGMRLSPHHPWIDDAFPLSRSFDTAGWFTGTAGDMLTTISTLIGSGASKRALNGVYLGFDEWVEADADCARALDAAAQTYAGKADRCTRYELLSGFRGCCQAYTVLHSIDAFEVHRHWIDSHKARYGPGIWQRIDRGRNWTDRDIESAAIKLAALRLLWKKFFLTFDFLIMPATPFAALRKDACTQENRQRLLDLNAPASLGGLPVLTVPVSLGSGLTSGLQIVVSSPVSPAISSILTEEQPFAFSA